MQREPTTKRITLRIERASIRRALVLAAAAIVVVAGVSLAVPVTFSDGNVLGAKQLNDDFGNVEQRLSALEARAGTGARYQVRVSQIVALRALQIRRPRPHGLVLGRPHRRNAAHL